MSCIIWRIGADTPRYAAEDLSGSGARATGGRRNDVGMALLYASTSLALACLETLAHRSDGSLPMNRYLVEITLSDRLWANARRETAATLPVGWDAEPPSLTSMQFGADWVAAGETALMVTPSAIVPEEFNVLINPAHPDAASIAARKVRKWLYDTRIRKR